MMASGLNQYWKQRAPTGYVRNAPAYDALLAAIDKSHPIVELIGRHGSGKTMLLRSLADERPPIVEGAIEYFEGSPALPFAASIDSIAGSFGRAHGRCLLVVDEGELMPRTELLEGIARLSTGRWSFTAIVAGREPMGIGIPVHVPPLSLEQLGQLLESRTGQAIPAAPLAKLWAASQGIPRLACMLAERWNAGGVGGLEALADLLSPLAVPGLVDSDGRPLTHGSTEEKRIISDVRFVSDKLLWAVGKNPNLVHDLTAREFEELSAELFQRQGYTVTMTPQTRDGGKDLYLAKADGFGSFLYIVECKRYAPHRPVDVGVVRALYGVAQHERVTAAMTLTTSYFSKDAAAFAADVQYQLALKDFIDLKMLLAPYRGAV